MTTTSLDQFVQDASTGLYVPPQSRVPLIPYDDMQAIAQPARLSQLSHDVTSTIAIMSGQGLTKPKLVGVSDRGEVKTLSTLMPTTVLSDTHASGSKIFNVVDSTGFVPNMQAQVISAANPSQQCTEMQIQEVPDQHTIIVLGDCTGLNFVPGDVFTGMPLVGVMPGPFAIPVSEKDAPANYGSLVTGVTDANNGIGSVFLGAITGFFTYIHSYTFRAASNAATAYGSDIRFTDEAGVEIWRDGTSLQAVANAVDHGHMTRIYIRASAPSKGITMATQIAVPATVFVVLSMATAYHV